MSVTVTGTKRHLDLNGSTLTTTGKITGTELEGTSLDINGNADISGNLVITGAILNNVENNHLDIYGGNDTTNDAHIKLHGNANNYGSIEMNYGYDATNSYFKVKQGSTENFVLQGGNATFAGNTQSTYFKATSGGNVALGNTSGIARLQHEGSGQLKMLSSGDSHIATLTSTGSTFAGTVEAPTLYGNHANGNGSSLKLGRADTSNYWLVNHAGADFRLYNAASSGSNILFGVDPSGTVKANRVGIATADPTEKLHVVGNIKASGSVTANSFSGDGSNLTNISSTDSSKVAKAGDTMTGNLTLNDNVNLRFGTSGAESTIKSDGADTIMTLSSGSFLIGTNGGTPHDNSGKADFVVDINASPQISLYSNQVQAGGTDMNWNTKWNHDNGQTNFGTWDADMHIFTQGSSGNSQKTIWIRPQGTDGAITTRAKFMGDNGVYLYGPNYMISDGSNADGATLKLIHANNNSTDTIGTIWFGNNADNTLSHISSNTSGANNTSNLVFKTSNAGSLGTVLTLNADNSATFSGEVSFKPKHYGYTDDPNSSTRTIFSSHDTNGSTSNRPVNWSSIYTLGGGSRNTLQISTNEDYSESGMWIRQYNSNSASPQGSGYQNWAEVWTTNHAALSKITNWDTAYNWGNHASAGYVTTSGAQTISGDKTFTGSTNVGELVTTNHIYGRYVNNSYSHLYRFGGLFLTWDSDSYGTNFNHSITSTDNGTYSDSITINSFDKVRINIDSNNNDSGSTFSIGKHGTGTSGTLLTLEEDGDLTVTGDVISNGTVLTGAPDLSGYVTTSGNQTITGVKSFTGELHWDLSAGEYAGDPRAVVMGYSGGNYGQLGYNIDFTSTSSTHNRVFNDIPTRIDLHNGIVVYASDAGSAGTSISWTEVLEAQRDAFQYKGNDIYHAGNKPTASDVGLGNVTNESKSTMFTNAALTGNPTAPTQSAGNSTTRIATTAFVSTAVSNLVDTAPDALNTLNELAAALGDDANFSTTITNSIATKLPLAGGTLTGDLIISHTDSSDPYILKLTQGNNGSGAGIQFNDNPSGAQKGYILHRHSDSESYGGGASFQFRSTEDDLVLSVGNADSTHGRVVVWSGNSASEVDYGFAQDIDTGMRRTSADNVSLMAGGVAGVGVSATASSMKYAGSTKIATTNTGISVTGNIAVTGTVDGVDISNHNHDDRYYTETEIDNFGFLTSSSTQSKYLRSDANDTFTGNLTNNGDNHITFGANSTWGSSLRVGGNGHTATGTEMASVVTTDGNLHLDAADSTNATYINFYAGTGGTIFGNGSNGIVARIDSSGNLMKATTSGNNTATYWHSGNDGAGTGLDADLLDGNHASAFATASHSHSNYITSNAADSFTGLLTWDGTDYAAAINLSEGNMTNVNQIEAYEFSQRTTGEPRNNLGTPTVTEMALFDNQFTPKTTLAHNYNDLADITFFKKDTSGGSYTEVTVSDDQKRKFLRTNNSSVVIPNGTYQYKVEFVAHGYTFLNAMIAYWSSNGHNTPVHIYKRRCSDNTWIQHTNSSTTVSSWPGHLWLPFDTIPWHETNTSSTGHFNKVRIEFTPNWHGSYTSNSINIYGIQLWGGYPSGRRTVHSYDQNGKLSLFGDLHIPGNLTINGTVPTWNQNTTGSSGSCTGNAATATSASSVPYSGVSSKPTFVVNSALSSRTTTTPNSAGNGRGVTFNYLSDSASNAPTGTDHSLMTMAYNNSWQTQLAQDWREEGRIYVRGRENGTWSSWNQVWDSSDFAKADVLNSNVTLSSLGAAASSHNHDSRYYTESEVDGFAVKLTGAQSIAGDKTFTGLARFEGSVTIDTDTNSNTLNISRSGSTSSQVMKIGILDTVAEFNYIEDTSAEGNGNFGQYIFKLGGNDGETTVSALNITKTGISAPNLSGTNTGDQDISGIATNATAISNITSFPGFGTSSGTALEGNTVIPSGNQIIDWTSDQGSTNIHANNIPDLSGTYLTSLSGAVLTSNTAQTIAGTKTYSSAIIANGGVAIQDIGDTTITRHSAGHLQTSLYRIFDDGYHPNADTWTTARTITLGGDLSGSVSIDGSANVTLTATVANDSHSHSNYITSNANDTVSANTTWGDSNQARFGAGGDLRIQHNGTNSYIDNHTGNLYIRNNATSDLGKDIYIQAKSGEASIYAFDDADVELYYNNSKKFSTTSTGFECNGTEIDTSSNGGGYKIGFNVSDNFSFSGYNVAHYGMSNAGNDTGGGIVLSGYYGIRFAAQGNIRGHISQSGVLTMANDVIAFGSPSDISLKENIKPINNALEKVDKLKGVTFKWKEAGLTDLKEDIGFIAQDVQEVLPELVRENDNGKLSLRDKGIVPVLVEAIKELKAEIDELKKCNKCKNCNCNG